MNISRRIVVSVLIALLIALTVTSCTAKTATDNKVNENTIIDGADRELVLPEEPDKATAASVYAVSVPFFVALDITDRVVAVNTKSKFWKDADESLAKAGSIGRGIVDMEKLALYKPTVLVHRSNDLKTIESVSQLGIDTLCITVEDVDDIKYTLEIMGKYFGREERAKEVCDYLDSKFKKIDEIVSKIPQDERVTALMMGGELGRIAGGDMLQSWMIEKAGGISSAKGTSNNRSWQNIGVETIFEWNPDILFCTSSTSLDYKVEDLYKDSAWSAVNAVKNKKVFRVPAKIDSWDMPGISCSLATMYMLHSMYPEYLTTQELQQEIDEYYTFMFSKTFDNEYLGYELED